MTPLAMLDEMERLLDGGRRWYKGGPVDSRGRICLLRAGGTVGRLSHTKHAEYRENYGALTKIEKVMEKIILEQFSDVDFGYASEGDGLISGFNDHPDIKWPDVESVIGKTRVILQEEAS